MPIQKEYLFTARFGDEDRTVRITLMNYGSIHVNVGGYSYAAIVNNHGIGWTVYPYGNEHEFRGDDVMIDDLDAILDRGIVAGFIEDRDAVNYGRGWKVPGIDRK